MNATEKQNQNKKEGKKEHQKVKFVPVSSCVYFLVV